MNRTRCKVCNHPDRPLIDEQLSAGALLKTLSARYGMSMMSLSGHRANHLGSNVAPALSQSIRQAADHLADLERRIASANDEDVRTRLLAERGRALSMLARLKGDSLQSNVATVVSRLGFPSLDALQTFIHRVKQAESAGLPHAITVAERLLRAWNDAHPDQAREVRVRKRVKYAHGSGPTADAG